MKVVLVELGLTGKAEVRFLANPQPLYLTRANNVATMRLLGVRLGVFISFMHIPRTLFLLRRLGGEYNHSRRIYFDISRHGSVPTMSLAGTVPLCKSTLYGVWTKPGESSGEPKAAQSYNSHLLQSPEYRFRRRSERLIFNKKWPWLFKGGVHERYERPYD